MQTFYFKQSRDQQGILIKEHGKQDHFNVIHNKQNISCDFTDNQFILKINNPSNLEEWILSQVGEEIYNTFIKGYTTKQWQKDPKNLPTSIIKRLPIRTNFDDNYFFDKFQGIPIGGYTKIFEKILDGIEVRLNTDYFSNRDYYNSIAEKIVFTGKIDEFFDYKFGELEYRTLRFENERLNIDDFQGCSQVNYTDEEVLFTRITEHKHFEKNVMQHLMQSENNNTPREVQYFI